MYRYTSNRNIVLFVCIINNFLLVHHVLILAVYINGVKYKEKKAILPIPSTSYIGVLYRIVHCVREYANHSWLFNLDFLNVYMPAF